MEPLTLGQLRNVWHRVVRDRDAHKALVRLEGDGFRIRHLKPQDPTFKHPTWTDYIAAIPLLPTRPSRRQIHRRIGLRKYSSLVSTLRRFVEEINDPFCEFSIVSTKDCSLGEIRDLVQRATKTADFLEKFVSWDWCSRQRNPRNALIAELRWTIRERTGKPHDRELSTVIDAACRAAGREELCLDNTTLDRIEKREKESRGKSFRRLNSYAELSRKPLENKSTRNPQKRR